VLVGARVHKWQEWWRPKWSLAMETIEHKGHRITFEVADRRKGWTWTFRIDSGPVCERGRTSPK
jgi:hypothetical protein